MATITPTAASSSTSVTPAAASAGGDTVATGSAQRTILNVVNASGSSITVTLAATQGCNIAGVLHNVVVTCAASKTTPISLPYYCEDASGNVAVTYSAVTSVTVYAVSN